MEIIMAQKKLFTEITKWSAKLRNELRPLKHLTTSSRLSNENTGDIPGTEANKGKGVSLY
jgi:hypothetical protein